MDITSQNNVPRELQFLIIENNVLKHMFIGIL